MLDKHTKQVIAPGAARRYAPLPRRRQFDSRRIYVRARTGPQSAHLWWLASCRQQTCLQPRLGQTDELIAVSHNAPAHGGGIMTVNEYRAVSVLVCVSGRAAGDTFRGQVGTRRRGVWAAQQRSIRERVVTGQCLRDDNGHTFWPVTRRPIVISGLPATTWLSRALCAPRKIHLR